MMYPPGSYPPGTYINCVLVTGEGHGRIYACSPMDAHEFILAKSSGFSPRFYRESDSSDLMTMGEIEKIQYEPFLEMWNRQGFIRLFRPRHFYDDRAVSLLQIADALRIAGVTEL